MDDAGAFTGHAAERVPAGNRPQHQFADGESRYTDLLVDLLLLLRRNLGRRLVKSPKVYVRDSGLLHALLSVPSMTALNDHPIVDPSWEGFVIENLIKCAPPWTQPFYYRTSTDAERMISIRGDLGPAVN